MTHDEIAAGNVVDRYLMGKLAADESARFEEHFVDCPECLEQLELSERFQGALQRVAAQGALTPARATWPRAAWLAVAAAILATAGLAAWLGLELAGARRQAVLNRTAAVGWQRKYERERAAGQSRSPLLAATFFLNVTRGPVSGPPDPANRIVVPAGERWIVLSLEGSAGTDFESLRASLADASGRVVWEQGGAAAGRGPSPSLVLPAELLRDGDYSLVLMGLSHGAWTQAARYRFRVSLK